MTILWIGIAVLAVALLVLLTRWTIKRRDYLRRRKLYVTRVLGLPVGYYQLRVLWFDPVIAQPVLSEVVSAAKHVFRMMEKGYCSRSMWFATQADLVVYEQNRLR